MCSVCVKWRWKYEWMKKREETFSPRGVNKQCSIFNRSKIALVAVSVPSYGGCAPLSLPGIPRCVFGEISPSRFLGGFPTWSSRLSFLSYCLRGGKLICKRKEVLYTWPQFLVLVGDNNLPKEDWVTPPPVPHTLIPRDPGPAAVTPSPNSTLRKSEQVYGSLLPAAGMVNPHRSLESNLGKPIPSLQNLAPLWCGDGTFMMGGNIYTSVFISELFMLENSLTSNGLIMQHTLVSTNDILGKYLTTCPKWPVNETQANKQHWAFHPHSC